MSLKIFAVPFLIICTLVISISYIKPDVALLFEKRLRLERLQSQSVAFDAIAANIKSMQAQIVNTNSDPESPLTDVEFLRQVYFPATSDIEKGIDQLNFLANQSGVIVKDVQVDDFRKVSSVAVPVEDPMQTSADLLIAKQADGVAEEVIQSSVHRTYVPDAFTVEIKTTGSYEATRDFYARVVQAKRFFFPQTVELAIQDQENVAGATTKQEGSSNLLTSTMEVQFLLLPSVSIASAIGDDAFEKAKLDFETLAMIRRDKQGVTPVLPAANPLGKTNLFVK